METSNIKIENLSQDLFNTSTPPQENNSYGLENARSTNNNLELINYNQIIFIDSTVEDYPTLIDNLIQPTEVVVLDPQRDGIVQITESLKQYNDLDGIHIVSHGDIGELSLGNSKLNQNTLSNYGDELTSWADSLAHRIAGSSSPSFIRERILNTDRFEFERFEAIINNPNIPFNELEVVVSDDRLIPYFDSLINEFDIPAQIIVQPTQIP